MFELLSPVFFSWSWLSKSFLLKIDLLELRHYRLPKEMSRYLLLELDRIENWDIQQLLTGLFIDRSMKNSLDKAAAAAVFSIFYRTSLWPIWGQIELGE